MPKRNPWGYDDSGENINKNYLRNLPRTDIAIKDITPASPQSSFSTMFATSQRGGLDIQQHLMSNGLNAIKYITGAPAGATDPQACSNILKDAVSCTMNILRDMHKDVSICYNECGSNHFYFVYQDVCFAEVFITADTVCLTIYDENKDIEEIFDKAEENFNEYEPVRPVWIHVLNEVSGPQGMQIRGTRVDITKQPDWAVDEYYPNLPNGIDAAIDQFAKARDNLWIYYGLPGTGKSTLLRHVCRQLGNDREVFILSLSQIIHTPDFTAVFNQFEEGSLLIIEDSDVLIGKREDGNQFMSTLLNKLDGIVKSDIKIIISTNLTNLKSVDEALLRPGRLYDATYFGKLDQQQVDRIASKVENVTNPVPGVLAQLFGKPAETGSIGFK